MRRIPSVACAYFVSLCLCVIIFWATSALAAPNITSLSVRGFQIGGTTKVTIQGSSLLPAPKLVTRLPIAKQVVLEKATANRVEIQITLAEDVTPGMYNLRLANETGISPAVIVAADALSQQPFAAKIESLPVALHGNASGSNVVKTTITGKKGQQILAEVEAKRLGGKLRPVLHLYDATRKQIAWSYPVPSLAGDTRLTATLPSDGEYTFELHDLQYAGGAPAHFRLKVGSFQFADLVFPPAIERGKKTSVAFVGNFDGDTKSEVTATTDAEHAPAPWPRLALASGCRPKLLVSDILELLEAPPAKERQVLPSIPVAVSGRLDASGQEDSYRVAVTEGAKLRFEVFADRLGAPIDPILEIKNEKGARLGLNDDIAGTADSRLDYTVAKGVKNIDVFIKDQADRGDERSIYRLVVSNVAESQRPSFKLKLAADTHNVPQGARRVVQVIAERSGYNGPIELSIDNLPQSISASALQIPEGANAALITLDGAGSSHANGIASIRGRSVGVDPPITATAYFDKHPLGKNQPWMQHDVALALAPPNSIPFQVDWNQTSGTQLAFGTTPKLPVGFVRPAGAIGPIRLSVVVSEPVPIVNNRADANQAVRAERATVDLPIDAKAKAAFDALTAAKKAVADAKTKAKATSDAQAKAVAVADAAQKQAKQNQANAAKQLAAVQGSAKSATKSRDELAKAVEQAKAELVAAGDDAKAAAQTKLNNATQKLVAADKTLATVNTQVNTAQTATNAANKALARADARLQAVMNAAKKANDAEIPAVKAAETKQATAEKNLQSAEANIKNEATFNIIVPPNFKPSSCDLAVKAELRSVDNRTVLVEAYTPVRRFAPFNPLGLKLAGASDFEAKLDAKTGATVMLTGTIDRKAGFNGDVTVSISGQPGGVAVPKVVVKPDKNDFALELKFPANFKPANVKTIKLFATGPPDKAKANIVVRTEIPIGVNVLAADPPEKKEG